MRKLIGLAIPRGDAFSGLLAAAQARTTISRATDRETVTVAPGHRSVAVAAA